MWRITSAAGEPPGSRVSFTPTPSVFSFSASSLAWVDLPDPSPPSKVMNFPRIPSSSGGRDRSPADGYL